LWVLGRKDLSPLKGELMKKNVLKKKKGGESANPRMIEKE